MIDYLALALTAFLSATILPLPSETAYIPVLLKHPTIPVLLWASIWNTLGSMTSYYLGYLAKWEWIEKILRTRRGKIRIISRKTRKWGVYIGLMTWLPFVGDIFPIVMGFLRYSAIISFIVIFIGKMARYIAITIIVENDNVASWLKQLLGIS